MTYCRPPAGLDIASWPGTLTRAAAIVPNRVRRMWLNRIRSSSDRRCREAQHQICAQAALTARLPSARARQRVEALDIGGRAPPGRRVITCCRSMTAPLSRLLAIGAANCRLRSDTQPRGDDINA